jgi:hypothetical protein
MAQVDRELKWRLAEDHRLVQVAGRHRPWAYDRFPLVPSLWLGHVLPGQSLDVFQYQ